MSSQSTVSFVQQGLSSDTSKYMIDSKDIVFSQKLAQGAYGIVYLGEWRKQPVAVKELKINESSVDENRDAFEKCALELKNEIQTLSLLRHRNIVNFMGIFIKPPDTYAIVTEFIEGGSLFERLHAKSKKANFSWNQKLSILHQISQACLFLHQQGIVHRDLKSQNILLEGYPGDKIIPKVCDFGLAKSRDAMETANATSTQQVGTPLWMAPEVVQGGGYGSECDIYSYSIIMYEILMEKLPYGEQNTLANIQFKVAQDPNFRPTVPSQEEIEGSNASLKEIESKKEYIELMKKSWRHDPKARPKFEEIVDTFGSLLKKMKE